MHQFTHIEGYALSASTKSKGKRLSVQQIIDEVLRVDDAVPHVENPKPPAFLIGDLPTVKGIPARIRDRVTEWNAAGKAEGRKALRKDSQVLLTQICSYPGNGEAYPEWRDRNLAYLRKTWGSDLVAVVEHTDEAHPHLHAYVLPSGGSPDIKRLHPGHAAAKGASNPKEQRNLYIKAMRGLQDDYYRQVGAFCGMARKGPGKRRLTRAAWQSEQDQAAAIRVGLELVTREQAALDDRRADLEKRQAGLDVEVQAKATALKRADAVALMRATVPDVPETPRPWEVHKVRDFFESMMKVVKVQAAQVANLPLMRETIELVKAEAARMKRENDSLVETVRRLQEQAMAWSIVQQIAPDVAREVVSRMNRKPDPVTPVPSWTAPAPTVGLAFGQDGPVPSDP